MIRKLSLILSLITVVVAFPSYSQNVLMEGAVHYGSIVKHSKKMDHFTFNNSLGFDISISQEINGTKRWHRSYHYLEIGGSFIYTNFGNSKLLGSAYGVLPFVSISIINKKLFSFRFKVGAGIAFLNRPYDAIENPENVAIASRINNITEYVFGLNWKIRKDWVLHSGVGFKHHSNAAFKAPNLGLNMPFVILGIKRRLTDHPVEFSPDTATGYDKKIHAIVRVGLAIKEDAVTGGPKYPVYITVVAVSRALSPVNRLSLGIYTAYYTGLYDYMINFEIFEGDNQRFKATRIGLEIGDEFVFGHVGINGQVGYYLHSALFKPGNFYTRLGVLYHFMNDHLFGGLFLKVHRATADYLDFTVGARF